MYCIGTTVTVDWTIVTDRVPVVYMALQVLGYRVIVITSPRTLPLNELMAKRAAALRKIMFAPVRKTRFARIFSIEQM